MFKYISIAQSIYLIINLLIFIKLFIEYPSIICYLLIIDMDFYYAKSIKAFFKKTTKKNSNYKILI